MKDSGSKTICFFNTNRAWGGGEKWHLNTAKEFQRRGHKTYIVAHTHSQLRHQAAAKRLNVYAFNIGNLSFLNPIKILIFMLFFRLKKIETVVMNLPSDLKLAGIAAKLAGIKTIIYRRGMPHPLRPSALNKFLFTKVLTHVVVNSEEIGRSLLQGNESWFPKEKMVLIYNGIDLTSQEVSHTKFYHKDNNEWIIGSIGRLTQQKGHKYLIDMALVLKNKNHPFKILIAGEGELHKELQAEIDKLGLSQNVKILGHVENIPSFMNSLDVFVFPSLFEGSANTLIEILHHGVPAVAFDVSSNPEIIQNQVTGILVKAFNVDELAVSVEKLLNSPQLREEFSRNGQKLVKEKFDNQKNLDLLTAII